MRNWTRKRRALVWAGVAVALYLIYLLTNGSCFLLPEWVVRQQADRRGLDRVEVVADLGPLPQLSTRRLYLSTDGQRAMLSLSQQQTPGGVMRGFPFGWLAGGEVVLDCSGEGPVHVGSWTLWRRNGAEDSAWFFGRLDDPSATTLAVTWEGREVARTTAGSWYRRDGDAWFVFSFQGEVSDRCWDYVIEGYDAGGSLLFTVEPDAWAGMTV